MSNVEKHREIEQEYLFYGPKITNRMTSLSFSCKTCHMKNEMVADSYDVHDSFIHKEEQKNTEITTLLQNNGGSNVVFRMEPYSRQESGQQAVANVYETTKDNAVTHTKLQGDTVPPAHEHTKESDLIATDANRKHDTFCQMFRERDQEFVWKLGILSQRKRYFNYSLQTKHRNGKRKKWYCESDLSDIELDDESDVYRTIRSCFRVIKDTKTRLRSHKTNKSKKRLQKDGLLKGKGNQYSSQQNNNHKISVVGNDIWFWDIKCRQAVAICLDRDSLTRDIRQIFGSS
eukprot:jgi/Galph1/2946/GphlegSOOS_G1607.1